MKGELAVVYAWYNELPVVAVVVIIIIISLLLLMLWLFSVVVVIVVVVVVVVVVIAVIAAVAFAVARRISITDTAIDLTYCSPIFLLPGVVSTVLLEYTTLVF